MTSQNKSEARQKLEAEAKELGLKGVHLGGDENLQKRINEAKETEAKPLEAPRSKAPRMNVEGINRDDRAVMIEQLEREDPESKYIFQGADVTDRELKVKGFERTQYGVKNDIICRTNRESFDEFQDAKNRSNYESMKALEGKNSSYEVPCLDAAPKKPRS